jgi:hypothetical protein
MGSARDITLKTNGVAPQAQTQLGGTTSATILATTPVNGSIYGTITITTPGIYIFAFAINQSYFLLTRPTHVRINGTNANGVNYGFTTIDNTNQIGFVGTQIIRATASAYTLVITLGSPSTLTTGTQGGYFTATRIG